MSQSVDVISHMSDFWRESFWCGGGGGGGGGAEAEGQERGLRTQHRLYQEE